MKFVGLCSSLAVVANGKPQNVEQFYSDYFQDNNQQDQVASDIDGGVQADSYDEYTDYGSGSGDFERDASDIAESFMNRGLMFNLLEIFLSGQQSLKISSHPARFDTNIDQTYKLHATYSVIQLANA